MSKVDMKGWTPEQIKAYQEAEAALAAEESAIAEARARQAREAASPEALAEKLREQAAAAREARARAERDAEDDAAYRKACKEHGGEQRVARTRTVDGSVIQRAMTRQEHEEFSDRISGLESEADVLKVARAATLDTVVHPPRPRMLQILERYPRLWVHLYAARDELITGVQEAARGKG
ncbi:hypothetical protein WME98_49990 [Sorangium sp. So ce296]|uniref:hypothetical protein n=1 Tax=Sorangium sp. So ce296 TaxID=3133296 RepID=UPI003F62CB1D